ncbi:MAG TPA: MarC family protein [Thermoanaerobaculia bacterium]
MTIASAAVLLFLVMDPLGNIPLFLAALRDVDPSRRRFVILREACVALLVLVVFLFAGRVILDLLNISEPALTAAGGVILLLIALRMIFPTADRSLREETHGEPFIVPLAIPYIAGASALATELLLMSREPERWLDWLIALALAWTTTTVILYFASGMSRFLHQNGLIAIERLMGMVLVTVAMEMLMAGFRIYVRG